MKAIEQYFHLLYGYTAALSGQDEPNPDWLPERTRWSYLACLGLAAVSCKKNLPEVHIINPLLIKLVLSRWRDIGLILFGLI